MEDTGRIHNVLTPLARKILFGETAEADIDADLFYISQVDRAHLVMLAERRIIDHSRACRLLQKIEELRACDFRPLRSRFAPRGIFLLYENYLIEELGSDTGGVLQTARSRNDLNATTLRLRLRWPYVRLVGEALRLQSVLLRRVRRYRDTVMPAYTHYQPAVPITYGHYLAGIALAIEKDIAGLYAASDDLNRCPLGAGAVGGTSLPIDTARTAHLLGFDSPVAHSIDAVASRDVVLRLLSSMAIFGVTLSRLAADLLLWATGEFGFMTFPDHLVGSSSMMPQKRNPFLLEHVQGRSAAAVGAFVAAATAMHAKPFTNSISVGTEAVSHLWQSLQKVTEATILARLMVAGATPQPDRMLQRSDAGYTQATEFANRLVVEGGMPFRAAHKHVGSIICEAIDNGGEPLCDAAARWQRAAAPVLSIEGLDPASVARASIYGGGPGPAAIDVCLNSLRAGWSQHRARKREQVNRWSGASDALDGAVKELCLTR